MTDTAINRDPYVYTSKVGEEKNTYVVDATGASITAESSISLIYWFCEKLPFDK